MNEPQEYPPWRPPLPRRTPTLAQPITSFHVVLSPVCAPKATPVYLFEGSSSFVSGNCLLLKFSDCSPVASISMSSVFPAHWQIHSEPHPIQVWLVGDKSASEAVQSSLEEAQLCQRHLRPSFTVTGLDSNVPLLLALSLLVDEAVSRSSSCCSLGTACAGKASTCSLISLLVCRFAPSFSDDQVVCF